MTSGSAVSVKDFGAVGDADADDGPAIQAALDHAAGATGLTGETYATAAHALHFPAGQYKVGATLTLANIHGLRITGEGRHHVTLLGSTDDTNVLEFTKCSFFDVSGIGVQHGWGTTGGGIAFLGTGGSNSVDGCYFANCTTHALSFVGDVGVTASSGNRTTRCLFLANPASSHLLYRWSNDFEIHDNAYAGVVGVTEVGCYIQNSSAGTYTNNEHWDNQINLALEDVHYSRFVDNRLEMARWNAVTVVGSTHCSFSDNMLHTNGQEATGTYSAVNLIDAQFWNVADNHFFTWDAGTYKHRCSLYADAACDFLNIHGNLSRFNAGADDFETSAASNVSLANNLGSPT
jgi:hypothetical protein